MATHCTSCNIHGTNVTRCTTCNSGCNQCCGCTKTTVVTKTNCPTCGNNNCTCQSRPSACMMSGNHTETCTNGCTCPNSHVSLGPGEHLVSGPTIHGTGSGCGCGNGCTNVTACGKNEEGSNVCTHPMSQMGEICGDSLCKNCNSCNRSA